MGILSKLADLNPVQVGTTLIVIFHILHLFMHNYLRLSPPQVYATTSHENDVTYWKPFSNFSSAAME